MASEVLGQKNSKESHQNIPGSSGYKLRSQGIVGSIKGRGVLSSKKIGRLIATFDPLRRLILAVRVLAGSMNTRIVQTIRLDALTEILHEDW